MQNIQCEVTWSNLELTTKNKKIINNATGQIRPATLTAIMGPSGSGKTSLLNALAGRIEHDQELKGEITVNGHSRDQKTWPRIVSYVSQTFHAYEYQTIYETMEFAAKAKPRLNDCLKESWIPSKINEIISMLGLTDSKNTLIKNLSGGERMRVSIGLELLGDPAVLLVDEPLSGLDSYNAVNVLDIFKKIAETGKTVLVTIHQPSYMMMDYFDKIMLMCQGYTMFEGTMNGCIKFFEECGYELPKNATATDFFLTTLSVDNKNESQREASMKRIQMIRKEWEYIRQEPEITMKELPTVPRSNKMGVKIKMLLFRSLKNYLRNEQYLKAKIFQKVFIAVLFGLTFYGSGLESADVFTFRGIVSFVLQTELFGVSGPIMNTFIDEKNVIARECRSGFYSAYEAFFAKHMTEIILNYLYAVPFHAVIYFLVGFPFNLRVICVFYLIILAVINYSVTFGLTIAAFARNTQAAQVLGVTFNIIFMLYSGSFSNPKTLPSISKQLMWLSPIYYGFSALVQNQLSALPVIESSEPLKVSNPGTAINFGLDGVGVGFSLTILLCIGIGLQLLGSSFLRKRVKNNLKINRKKKEEI